MYRYGRGVWGLKQPLGLCHIKIGAISFQYVFSLSLSLSLFLSLSHISYRHDSFTKLQSQKMGKLCSQRNVTFKYNRCILVSLHENNTSWKDFNFSFLRALKDKWKCALLYGQFETNLKYKTGFCLQTISCDTFKHKS